MNNSKRHKSTSEEQKSKRARLESIRLAVSNYMNDKRYVSTKKIRYSDLNLSQANKQFVFNKMIKNDAFINNFFLFSNVTCNSTSFKFINEQFKKLADFVEAQKSDVKVQLRQFYSPIICHLYLEILKGRDSSQAMNFLRNNFHHIPSDRDRNKINETENSSSSFNYNRRYYINLVKLLFACPNLDAAENVREIIAFRSSKFEIDVNTDAIKILNEFLQNHANVLLLSTIHTWIHINVIHAKDCKSDNMVFVKEKECSQFTEMKPPLAPPKNPHIKKEQTHVTTAEQQEQTNNVFHIALNNINHIMHEMRKTHQDYPHYVKVFDPNKFLTSGHCDRNQCHVAAGFDNSVVKIWQHNGQTLRGKNVYSSYIDTVCPWNVNNQFTPEEDEDEMDDTAKLHREIMREELDDFPVSMNNQALSGEIVLHGHSRGVTDLHFSSYFPILLTVSKDESMRCWSANNYRCSRVYNGHTNPIWCVNESPLGSYVATGSKDLTARLWNLERDFPLITYIGHTQDVNCLAFHPNGSYIATGSDDFSVRLWSVATGKVVRVFGDSKQPISTLAFSPDGKFLAIAGDERKIRILDLAAGQQLYELKEHASCITSINWSANGQQIASGSSDGVLKIWNTIKLESIKTSSSGEGSSSSCNVTSSTATPVTFSNNNLSRVCKVEYSADNVLTCIGRK